MIRPAYFLLASATLLLAADYAADGKHWWAHVLYLADDKLEGRNTGSPGHRKAAEYVAAEFERAGLKPAGTSGYFQPVRFRSRQIVERQSRLEILRDGKAEPVVLGEVANFSARIDPAANVEAPAVFVGYGLQIAERNYDDLAGLDLRGKIAVFLSGGPESVPGPLKSHAQHTAQRWKALQAAGAIGTVSIQNPKSMDIPWSRATLARLQPSMDLADEAMQETRGQQFSIVLNPAHAERFFTGSGHTFESILKEADAGRPLPRFPLPLSLRARVGVKRAAVESQNVAALLPGSDPKLRDEFVVLTAHLDHLGVGEPINGDSIYNGAMDDASGVASILEVARLVRESGRPPRRSLLFVAVTGEEKGLQGSRYFANRPTVKQAAIVADINLDMYLPLHPLNILSVQGADESTLGDDIRTAVAKFDVQMQPDMEPQRNLFIRSDQYSFIRLGVPALAFKFGFTKGSPEEKLHKDWLQLRYHAPSDDVHQPVDLEGAAKFNRIIAVLAESVANADKRPEWKPDSFFRRYAAGR